VRLLLFVAFSPSVQTRSASDISAPTEALKKALSLLLVYWFSPGTLAASQSAAERASLSPKAWLAIFF
jgi:hypothetical protein